MLKKIRKTNINVLTLVIVRNFNQNFNGIKRFQDRIVLIFTDSVRDNHLIDQIVKQLNQSGSQ